MTRLRFVVLTVTLGVGRALAQDPATLRPDMVKVEFENEQIRVLRVHYGPHEKLPTHSHPARVEVALTAKMRKNDGTLETVESRAPNALWSDKVTHEEENSWDEPKETIE